MVGVGRKWNRACSARRGFTLVELLVVIVIIVLLIGLLIPALARTRSTARKASTQSLMSAVATSVTAFKADKGRYPGYFSSEELGGNSNVSQFGLTQMENALLELSGGLIEQNSSGQPVGTQGSNMLTLRAGGSLRVAYVDPGLIGSADGPGYLSLGRDVLKPVEGQWNGTSPGSSNRDKMPDVVDPFGVPLVLWVKNPLAGSSTRFAKAVQDQLASGQTDTGSRALFYWASNNGMFQSIGLGIGGKRFRQAGYSVLGKMPAGSAGGLGAAPGGAAFGGTNVDPTNAQLERTLEALLGHPDLPLPRGADAESDYPRPAAPLADAILHSAGADSVYLSNGRAKRGNDALREAYYKWEGSLPGNGRALPIEKFDDIVMPGG